MTSWYGPAAAAGSGAGPGISGGAALSLVVTGLAVMGSPGPSTVSLVAVAGAYGLRPALAYCAGLVVGATVVLVAVATGVTAVLLALPVLRWVLTVVAVVYVLRLALRLALSPALAGRDGAGRKPSVLGGVLLGALNPKAWVAIGAVFLSTRLSEAPVLDATAKVVALAALIVVVHAGWLAAGRLMEPLLRVPRRARAVNVVLAGLLAVAMIPVLRTLAP
jgi:threonine/homoserine/homoserine lactone efflux protein